MKIGKYKLSFLETGLFSLDGGAMFGIIPKPLWEKSIVPDEKNRIKMGVRCLLLQSDSKKILVDTGMAVIGNSKRRKKIPAQRQCYSVCIRRRTYHALNFGKSRVSQLQPPHKAFISNARLQKQLVLHLACVLTDLT